MIELYKPIQTDGEWLMSMQLISAYSMDPDVNNEFQRDHGAPHAIAVARQAIEVLDQLGEDRHTIELGVIGGLIHDMAIANGRVNHAERGAELTKKYLPKFALSESDVQLVAHAVGNHSDGDDTQNNLDAALLLADKLDVSGQNIAYANTFLFKEAKKINAVNVKLDKNNLSLLYRTDPDYDLKSVYGWPKMIIVPQKVADYLERSFRFYINDRQIDLEAELPELRK